MKAHPDQAVLLTQISLAAKSHWGYPVELIEMWAAALTVTPASIRVYPTWFALANDEPAGFYQIRPGHDSNHLEHLWVLPSLMGRGMGRALLLHALAQAGGHLVIDADPHAEGFYLGCGATRTGSVAAPIPGDKDRILPQLQLRASGR